MGWDALKSSKVGGRLQDAPARPDPAHNQLGPAKDFRKTDFSTASLSGVLSGGGEKEQTEQYSAVADGPGWYAEAGSRRGNPLSDFNGKQDMMERSRTLRGI